MGNDLYFAIGVAVLTLAVGFLLSQYIEYKQFRLSQEKTIQNCINETVGDATGIKASLTAQKCREKFSR